jgi:DNA processing protein
VVSRARLTLAAAGLHPDRIRALLSDMGAEAAVHGLASGKVKASPRARAVATSGPAPMLKRLSAIGVTAALRGDAGYPSRLVGLPDAPDVLFTRGTIPESPAVAVVGTRRCTAYGRTLATAMGRAIAEAGWVTVSGLARGIDVAAHEGTLQGAGRGIAVLGSGPDVWYPPEHRRIGEELAQQGAVVTEFPPGTPPEPWRFPVRNRVISGLAEVLVVVEAGVTGGALITARLALEQGKQVFAVPGDIDREASRGTNLLIRDGAHPVFGAADLIEELSLTMGRPPRQPVRPHGVPILEALGNTGASADELARRFAVPIGDLLADLARLEASGTVSRTGDRYIWTSGSTSERA